MTHKQRWPSRQLGATRKMVMTDKQAVIDALNRFPENASLEEITEELPILGAIRHGREDIAAGCSKSQAEAESLLESCAAEFRTVDLIVASSAETRGVDAFALSVIEAERQIRRLVTHLVYQFPSFAPMTLLVCALPSQAIGGSISPDSFRALMLFIRAAPGLWLGWTTTICEIVSTRRPNTETRSFTASLLPNT